MGIKRYVQIKAIILILIAVFSILIFRENIKELIHEDFEELHNIGMHEIDVRFNRPAQDGEKYTDEGIYTITVKNRYTNSEPTKKTICVGEGLRKYFNNQQKKGG